MEKKKMAALIKEKITSIISVQHPSPIPIQWRENHLNTCEEEEGKKEDREVEEVEEEREKEEEKSQLMSIKTPNNDCGSSRRQKRIPVTRTKDFYGYRHK
jgi:hypothetical protein